MLNELLTSGIFGDPVIVLGTSREESEEMRRSAEDEGVEVKATTEWTGPIPERGSYEMLSPWVRMSTPEYFFYRKANQLPEREAVILGCELVSHYRTNVTAHNLPDDVIERVYELRTTVRRLRDYLMQVKDTPEGAKALRVLEKVRKGKDEYEELVGSAYLEQFR